MTQLAPEVFSGTSISQGAQYLGMDRVSQFALSGGPRIDVLNGGAQGMAKTNRHRARQNAGGGVVVTGWPGEISSSE